MSAYVYLCAVALMQWGNTAVLYAAEEGHLSVVEYLVGRGADIEAKGRVRGIVCPSNCAGDESRCVYLCICGLSGLS